jgi:hypothetical protein
MLWGRHSLHAGTIDVNMHDMAFGKGAIVVGAKNPQATGDRTTIELVDP